MKHIRSMVALAGLACWACGDSPMQSLAPNGETAVLAVSDGAHDGNGHFYFLPPLVANPSASGVFDGSLRPEVEVCIWDGSECGAVVVQFNDESGPGSQRIRVDEETGHYIVNWHTGDILEEWPLGAGETYRIRVLVGAQVLGWADVWIAPRGRGNARGGEDPLLVGGQTLPIKFLIEQGAPQEEEGAALSGELLSAGYFHTCAVDAAGAAWCWGRNEYGQLGTGSMSPGYVTTPQRVAGTLVFRSVIAGLHHTCGLTSDGAAYCWGYNFYGQLGAGSTSPAEAAPLPVAGGHTFEALAPGGYFSCGLAADGSVYCWGHGGQGQVGGGSYPYAQATPAPAAGGSTFRAVTAGQNHACGIASDGTAHCWGENTHGQLGVGGGSSGSPTPLAVAGGHTFASLEAGYLSTCGVTSAGVGYCWGHNAYGQVGNGSVNGTYPYSQPSPVAVAGGLSFAAMSAGGLHACGIGTDGAAFCWGFNGYGQLGDGTVVNRVSPAAVTGGFTFTTLTTGAYHTCGVTPALEALCWGHNIYGAVGDGTRLPRSQPVGVVGLDLTP